MNTKFFLTVGLAACLTFVHFTTVEADKPCPIDPESTYKKTCFGCTVSQGSGANCTLSCASCKMWSMKGSRQVSLTWPYFSGPGPVIHNNDGCLCSPPWCTSGPQISCPGSG